MDNVTLDVKIVHAYTRVCVLVFATYCGPEYVFYQQN